MGKVVIINTVALNGGDAAILDAVIESVKSALGKRQQDIVVLDRDAAVARRYQTDLHFDRPGFEICREASRTLPHSLVKFATLARTVALLAKASLWRLRPPRGMHSDNPISRYLWTMHQADVVVSTGGTMFVDRYSIVPKFVEIAVAAILRRRLVLFTQSFEPLQKAHNRFMMRQIGRAASVIMVRGSVSERALADMNVGNGKRHELADVVFRFLREEVPAAPRALVCISVRPWKHARDTQSVENYRTAIAGFAIEMVLSGKRVKFVSTCQGIEEYSIKDSDEAYVIAQQLPPEIRDKVEVDAAYHTRNELMDIFASSELVVATRLHACIMALCARSTVLPVAYEDKTVEVFGRINPLQRVLQYDDLQKEDLVDEASALLAMPQDQRSRLFANLQAEQRNAMQADGLLAQVMKS